MAQSDQSFPDSVSKKWAFGFRCTSGNNETYLSRKLSIKDCKIARSPLVNVTHTTSQLPDKSWYKDSKLHFWCEYVLQITKEIIQLSSTFHIGLFNFKGSIREDY